MIVRFIYGGFSVKNSLKKKLSFFYNKDEFRFKIRPIIEKFGKNQNPPTINHKKIIKVLIFYIF